ncbi:(2Fe-2S)-binding protein [Bacteriovoracaceae bacterium]|nr:(2Fe-2S)-binding protein [Bacteriovoracaceae bacterium]
MKLKIVNHLNPEEIINEVDLTDKETLLQAIKKAGVHVASSCGGVASCSECVIKVHAGAENLNEVDFAEKKLIGNVFFITKERLSCQAQCTKDGVTISVPN